MAVTPTPPTVSEKRLFGCLARLIWMAAVPIVMFQATFLLAEGRSVAGLPGVVPLLGVAVVAVAVRWVDVSLLHGLTAEGEPATPADWRRYSLAVLAVTGGLWLLATVVARLGWMG